MFYFSPRHHVEGSQDFLIYMGRDKYENEELLRHMWPTDVWFHVDDLSSAHVYLRLPDDATLDDIPPETLEDCAQLVKQNSIQGCKLNNVTIVYTPWSNLKKTAGMDVGQVGFHNERAVRKCKVEKKSNDIINRLERTRKEVNQPDLAGEKEAYEAQRRHAKRAEDRAARELEKQTKAEHKRLADLKEYKTLMKEENMISNKDIKQKYKSAEEFEDDFM